MSTVWHVCSDGRYRRITEMEDLLTDFLSTCEDIHETFVAFRDVSARSLAARQESRQLLERSQRERQLRATRFDLVTPIP